MNRKNMEIYGEPYAGDTRFVAACRQKQSMYRAMIGQQIKPYRGKDREYYFGNLIADGQSSGANFLEEYIFLYARYRVAYKKPYETINSDRLFNNLLSSQPMAFNLFCPLIKMVRESPEFATKAIKSALPNYPIDRVTEVDLEFIPDNYAQLTGDRSAMDAIIRFVDTEGKAGFIAIETKYSENLGTNEASKKELSIAAISTLRCFRADVEEKIRLGEIKLTQIYRNFLLSECYGRNIRANSYSLILSPHNHPSTQKEVASLAGNLSPDFKDKLQSVSLEQFVNSLIANSPAPFRATFEKFYNRYLDIKF